jgi:hypothetical protein
MCGILFALFWCLGTKFLEQLSHYWCLCQASCIFFEKYLCVYVGSMHVFVVTLCINRPLPRVQVTLLTMENKSILTNFRPNSATLKLQLKKKSNGTKLEFDAKRKITTNMVWSQKLLSKITSKKLTLKSAKSSVKLILRLVIACLWLLK